MNWFELLYKYFYSSLEFLLVELKICHLTSRFCQGEMSCLYFQLKWRMVKKLLEVNEFHEFLGSFVNPVYWKFNFWVHLLIQFIGWNVFFLKGHWFQKDCAGLKKYLGLPNLHQQWWKLILHLIYINSDEKWHCRCLTNFQTHFFKWKFFQILHRWWCYPQIYQ